MYFIVLFLAVVIVGYLLASISRSLDVQTLGGVMFFMGLILLTLSLFVIPLYRAGVNSNIAKHEAIRQTVIISREQGELTELERIRLIEDVLKTNKWLASTEYYASNPWLNIYYPKELDLPEPIY